MIVRKINVAMLAASLMGCDELIVNVARLDDLIEALPIFDFPYDMEAAEVASLLWRENWEKLEAKEETISLIFSQQPDVPPHTYFLTIHQIYCKKNNLKIGLKSVLPEVYFCTSIALPNNDDYHIFRASENDSHIAFLLIIVYNITYFSEELHLE